MTNIIYLRPGQPAPDERHVAVVVHRDISGIEKGYFYDSAEGDSGGAGPFDWLIKETMDRAERFATDRRLSLIVVRSKTG